jgi:soluble lytic murein transglycosylase-like protein/TolA-binding protein
VHHKAKFTRVVIVLATVAFLFSLAPAQSAQDKHQQLRSALDSGDVTSALAQLRSLQASNEQLFVANNYDYLFARLSEGRGDFASAAKHYQANIQRNSVLMPYSLWHFAQMGRATGDLLYERERLRMLLNLAPNGLLRDSAAMRLGQSFLESQDFRGAAVAFRQLSTSKSVGLVRESQALLGKALLKDGNLAEARDVFTKLLQQMPDAARPDDFALEAVRALDSLDAGGQSGRVGQLTEAEHLLRGSVYQFNRDFNASRLHYAAVLARFPQNPTVPNALYQIGRGFYLQQNYDEALKYLQRVLTEFAESMSARDALSLTAGSYNRLKRTDEAIAAYKLYSEKFADGPNPERPFLNIIDALHEAGRYREALEWVQQTRVRFRTQIGGALALFAQLRIHLAQGNWQSVVSDATELAAATDLGGTRVAGGTTQSELTFLRAFALEQSGRNAEAVDGYLSIADGRNDYYGKRATQHLLALAKDPKTNSLIQNRASSLRAEAEKLINAGKADDGRRAAQNALRLVLDQAQHDEILELVLRSYETLPSYRLPDFKMQPLGRQDVRQGASEPSPNTHKEIAHELLFLGLFDEGAPELVAARAENNKAAAGKPPAKATAPILSDADFTLAVYQLRGGHADQAVKFGEQFWRNVPGDYVLELAPRDLVDLLYPLPYRDSLLKHAPSRGVDPRFVISVARQESRFQPAAQSLAAARGLMQFIAETSNAMAAELSLQNFSQDDLYNADTAVLFGSQYLAGLFKQFPGEPQAVAASYNGGPENMARWLARSRANDPDRYVSEIGFAQTKDYVFKVMLNYWQYQVLYDEKLERK